MIPQILSVGRQFETRVDLGGERVEFCSLVTLDEALQHLHFRTYAAAIFSLPYFGEEIASFLAKAREASPLTPFILLVDEESEDLAVRLGTMHSQVQCLPVDVSLKLLELALRNALRENEKKKVRNKTMESSVNGTVAGLLEILSLVDPYSASVGQRLRYGVEAFAKAGRLPLTWELETAAILGQVGVLTIPVRVVMKHNSGQELSGFEKDMISRVAERGADLLQQIPFMAHVANIIRYQEKSFDGSGFPTNGINGERLPLASRVLKILNDLFRLEDSGLSRDKAMEQMRHSQGKYDPNLLRVADEAFNMDLKAKVPAAALPLTLKELRPGLLLVSGVQTKDGVLLIREGQIISPKIIHKLRNFACMTGIREPIHVLDLLERRKMITVFQDLAHADTSIFARRVNQPAEFVG